LVSVYPNPAAGGKITVENKSAQKINTIEVIGMQGELVGIMHPDDFNADIEVSHLEKGVYCLRIHSEESLLNKKIVIL
jgi:hypothetical protein